jgi:hypothetical protein
MNGLTRGVVFWGLGELSLYSLVVSVNEQGKSIQIAIEKFSIVLIVLVSSLFYFELKEF